jgi:integrase
MCDDTINRKKRELRRRRDNPCSGVRAPDRGISRAKQHLYPSEFLRFATCERVPLRWRRAVTIAIYSFTRDGELRPMRWQDGDVDLEHGAMDISEALDRRTGRLKPTKSTVPRRFSLEPTLLPLLKAMRREARGRGPIMPLSDKGGMARNLPRWLWKAGIRRPELHEDTPTRHDLRATGIT